MIGKGLRQFVSVWLAATVIAVGCGKAVGQDDGPIDEEHWYVVQLQGQQCGYMHTVTKRVGDEVYTRSFMKMAIARGEVKVEIAMDQNYRETLDGRPLGFQHEMTLGTMPKKLTGIIKDGKLKLVTEQFGAKQKATYDFDPDVKFAWGQFLEQRRRGLKPGTTYTIKTYEPSQNVAEPIEIEVKVRGKEKVDVLGKTRFLTRITATMLITPPIPTETWVDDDGELITTVVDMGILQVRVFVATKEQALADADAPELFVKTFVRVERRIEEDARQVKLRLRLPADAEYKMPDLPNTDMQAVKRVSDHEVVLTIQRHDWEKIRTAKKTKVKRNKKLKQYLRASTDCNTNDKRIKRYAKKAVKGCETPAEKADALRRYVTKFVRNKSLDVAFATASEVVRTREGDCTEHGVLLAALARAAGLPARGVSGIVQIPAGSLAPAQGSAFGYHMWTQVYIDGKWVDIDAALRQTDCDPTHIAVAIMPLNDEGMLNQVMSLLPLLGRLEIEVIDVKK